MVQDRIADMLTRIRNANQVRNEKVEMPSSKIKVELAKILKEEGYINEFEVEGDVKKTLTLTLKYDGNVRVITGIKRISKPGLKVYTGVEDLPRVLDELNIKNIKDIIGRGFKNE